MLYFCSNMNRFCGFSSEKSKLTRIVKEEFGATDAGTFLVRPEERCCWVHFWLLILDVGKFVVEYLENSWSLYFCSSSRAGRTVPSCLSLSCCCRSDSAKSSERLMHFGASRHNLPMDADSARPEWSVAYCFDKNSGWVADVCCYGWGWPSSWPRAFDRLATLTPFWPPVPLAFKLNLFDCAVNY